MCHALCLLLLLVFTGTEDLTSTYIFCILLFSFYFKLIVLEGKNVRKNILL